MDVCRFAMIVSTGTPVDEISCSMAFCSGAEYVYVNASGRGTLFCALADAGIPSVLLENGGGMSWSKETVARHIYSVRAIMDFLGMIPFTDEPLLPSKVILKIVELRFDCDGLQTHYVETGRIVTRDMPLIEVIDIRNGAKHKICCPVDKGIVLSIHTAAAVKKGSYAVMLGEM
ncbi:MAG: hypothetical protein A2Y21_03665 [Clostridiales bacterium GWC2_40_7]|nr:MAG: hypothetical protein A2Y21_03665 [Clostridiales bacterium GWC2_40_7]